MATKATKDKKATGKKTTGKPTGKPKINEILKPSNDTPIKDKKESEKTKEELLAEIAELKKSRGGRPKTDPMDKASIRVSFYITPRQQKQIESKIDLGSKSISEITKEMLLDNLTAEKSDEK